MKEVLETQDIFAVFNRGEWEARMKSLCPKIPSQEDNAGSNIESIVIAQEAVEPEQNDETSKPNATPKVEFNETCTWKTRKYPILPSK